MAKLNKTIDLPGSFRVPTQQEWQGAAEKLLKGKPFDKIMLTPTYEDIILKPIYFGEGADGPQDSPALRGNRPNGYLKKPWQIAQKIDTPHCTQFNSSLKNALENGQNTVCLYLDTCSQNLQDADAKTASGVGQDGLSLSTLEEMGKALNKVDLHKHALFVDGGPATYALSAMLLAHLEKSNIDPAQIKGWIKYDPLSALLHNGKLPYSLAHAFDEMAQLTQCVAQKADGLQTIAVDALYWQNRGANAVQEIAFALAGAAEYSRALMDRGLKINLIAARMRIALGIGNNFFMEIAKFRAIKPLLSKLMAAFGADEKNQKTRLHAATGALNKTLHDPYVNMLRTTTEAFSAVLGGIDSLQINPFDSSLRQTDDFSQRIARNLHYILKEETSLEKLIDPAGGSWYIENLSHDLAGRAWKLFQEIEAAGGMIAALKKKLPQNWVEQVRQKRIKNLETRKDKLIGTNIFPNISEELLINNDDDDFVTERVAYLKKYKTSGDMNKHIKSLQKLENIIKSTGSEKFSATVEAALNAATLGEINNTLYAQHHDPETIGTIKMQRLAEPYENLRAAMQRYSKHNGGALKVFLANMGTLKEYKARADFSTGFFQLGGFDIINPGGFSNNQAAAQQAIEHKASVIVVCSSDENYPNIVADLAKTVKTHESTMLCVVAGYPKDHIENFKAAGVDAFIHLKANAYQTLLDFQKQLGVQ